MERKGYGKLRGLGIHRLDLPVPRGVSTDNHNYVGSFHPPATVVFVISLSTCDGNDPEQNSLSFQSEDLQHKLADFEDMYVWVVPKMVDPKMVDTTIAGLFLLEYPIKMDEG